VDITSEYVHQLLQQAGWMDNRAIDTSEYQLSFEENELPILPAALKIPGEFGRLRLEGIDPYTQSNYVWLDIDPVFACDVQSVELLRDFFVIIERPLTPIGTAAQGLWILLVDAEGQIYANHDLDIYYLADNMREAIQILCNPKRKNLRKLGRVG
jgi:hypothetical protein